MLLSLLSVKSTSTTHEQMIFLPQYIGKYKKCLPVPQPNNNNISLQPPIPNPKYGLEETLRDTHSLEGWKWFGQRGRGKDCKLSPIRTSQVSPVLTVPWTQGGPNRELLKKILLDVWSLPVDWLNALLVLTLQDNVEYPEGVDVKEDK